MDQELTNGKRECFVRRLWTAAAHTPRPLNVRIDGKLAVQLQTSRTPGNVGPGLIRREELANIRRSSLCVPGERHEVRQSVLPSPFPGEDTKAVREHHHVPRL